MWYDAIVVVVKCDCKFNISIIMSSSEEEGPVTKRRRGIRNEESYRRNVIKKSNDSGKEHVNWVGKTISAKKPGSNVCR